MTLFTGANAKTNEAGIKQKNYVFYAIKWWDSLTQFLFTLIMEKTKHCHLEPNI